MTQSGKFGAVAATFADASKAKEVFNLLLESGFEYPWMAITEEGPADSKVANSSDGVLGVIGRFFGGTSSLRRSLVDHGISDDEAESIDASLEHGGAVVVLSYSQRIEVAISLLEREGGEIRSKPAADYDPRRNIDATLPGQGDELNRGSGRGNSGGGLGDSTGFWDESGAEKDMKAQGIGGLGDGSAADAPSRIETFYRRHDGTNRRGRYVDGTFEPPKDDRMNRTRRIAALALAAAVTTAGLGALPAAADDQEQQIGAQVYQQLEQKGEIIPRPNAMYAVLDPIARRIASVADQQYDYPFRFILVHESSPNAFAVPGGNVYVTDSLLKFVQNKEELAGVLCHETSHDIHHDVVNNQAKDQRTGMIIGVLGALTGLGNTGMGQMGENMAYTLQSNNFSRHVESAADHKGAETCAQSGYNPWGMVWLFENFEKADSGGSMEALSDHPNDDHRIADLESYFRSDTQLFGRFSSNIAAGTPIAASAAQPRRRAVAARRPQTAYCCGTR